MSVAHNRHKSIKIMLKNKCKECSEEQFSQCPDNPCNYRRQLPPPISCSSSLIKSNMADNDLELFILACSYGNSEQVKLLLENSVYPKSCDKDKELAILNAIYGGCTHIIDILIQYGWDINELKYDKTIKRNYLHFAIVANKPKMVKYFLHLGIDPNSPYGSIDIDVDYFTENFDILELMLSHGANMEKMSKGKKTLASCVMKDKRHYETTEFERLFQILHKYVGLERCDKYEYSISGRSLMHLAIYRNNIYYVDYLLKHGFDLNCRELGTNKTALHIAATKYSDLTKSLLEYGAITDTIDCDGNTALHFAIESNKYQNICYLLFYGARLNIVNFEGKTAVDLAIDGDDHLIIEWTLLFVVKVDDIERLLNTSKTLSTKIRKMLAQFVIKMKILKGNQDLNVGMDAELNKFKDKCIKELDIIKSLKILDGKVNCQDLLFAGKRKLVKLVSEYTKIKIMSFYNSNMFWKSSIYRDIFWKNINVGYVYEPVYDKAIGSFNDIVDYKLPILVVENVMNYLNYRDMKNLIKCSPQSLE